MSISIKVPFRLISTHVKFIQLFCLYKKREEKTVVFFNHLFWNHSFIEVLYPSVLYVFYPWNFLFLFAITNNNRIHCWVLREWTELEWMKKRMIWSNGIQWIKLIKNPAICNVDLFPFIHKHICLSIPKLIYKQGGDESNDLISTNRGTKSWI